MRRTFLALLVTILTLFYVSNGASAAEDSPFGDLSSEENNLRTVFGTENQNLDSYLDVKQSYVNLSELYERAFGTRKDEIGLQLVARAKDVLVSKTGAVLNYIEELLIDVEKTSRISEEELQVLSTSAAEFRALATEYEPEVGAKTTTEELETLAETYNESFIVVLAATRLATIQLAVARGEFLIQQMQAQGNLIQENLNASANVGGNVAPIQDVFNEGMLDLEEAEAAYLSVTTELNNADLEGEEKDYDSLLNKIISANKKVGSGHGSLKNVLSSLRALYSQSPWQLDKDGE